MKKSIYLLPLITAVCVGSDSAAADESRHLVRSDSSSFVESDSLEALQEKEKKLDSQLMLLAQDPKADPEAVQSLRNKKEELYQPIKNAKEMRRNQSDDLYEPFFERAESGHEDQVTENKSPKLHEQKRQFDKLHAAHARLVELDRNLDNLRVEIDKSEKAGIAPIELENKFTRLQMERDRLDAQIKKHLAGK